jgi:hypothetical protein
MNEFKSSIFDSIMAKVIRNVMLILILSLTSLIIDYSELIPIQIGFLGIIIIYLSLFIIQIFMTNNDLIIDEKEIIIQSSMFGGIRRKAFKKEEILEITFKDEWSETFMNNQYDSIIRYVILEFILMWFIPWEYKWIEITTKYNRKFKYYFFGMNYDFYDNSQEILFEDMFVELAKRNIRVKWKSTKDVYFKGIQERADEILLNMNK